MIRQVVIHDLRQARAALRAAAELGVAIQLRSGPDAAAHAGVGFLKTLGDALDHELVIDCDDDPGLAMAALRTGCRKLAFDGPAGLSEPLVDMAAQTGAVTAGHGDPPPPVLRLTPDDDPRACLAAWLAKS